MILFLNGVGFYVVALMYQCDEEWTQFQSLCYQIVWNVKPFDDAERSCEGEGGALASVENENKTEFVLTTLYVVIILGSALAI